MPKSQPDNFSQNVYNARSISPRSVQSESFPYQFTDLTLFVATALLILALPVAPRRIAPSLTLGR
jgi:hypothetical protein